MASRWYSPTTGQFTSADTASNSAVPDTANANPYGYANASPLDGSDPTGHWCVEVVESPWQIISGGGFTYCSNPCEYPAHQYNQSHPNLHATPHAKPSNGYTSSNTTAARAGPTTTQATVGTGPHHYSPVSGQTVQPLTIIWAAPEISASWPTRSDSSHPRTKLAPPPTRLQWRQFRMNRTSRLATRKRANAALRMKASHQATTGKVTHVVISATMRLYRVLVGHTHITA